MDLTRHEQEEIVDMIKTGNLEDIVLALSLVDSADVPTEQISIDMYVMYTYTTNFSNYIRMTAGDLLRLLRYKAVSKEGEAFILNHSHLIAKMYTYGFNH